METICFVMCTNNAQYEEEAIRYIQRLKVPEGYAVDLLTVKEAKSMTAGYNEAMQASDAKYKVYLHQDVFIINQNFLYDILKIFEDKEVGMIGMIGSPRLPENKIPWYGFRSGKIICNHVTATEEYNADDVEGEYQEVEAIDGLLMITQYDVPWRDDLFDKWDFYDISQSLEFRKKGYKVVVPNMKMAWCIHDDGFNDLKFYYQERKKLINEYYKNKKKVN